MLDQVNGLFGIVPDHDLDVIRPRQELHEVTQRVLAGMTQVIRADRPDAVIVQGDTTTTMVAALAAFYEQVPVIHLEAGLRTDNRYNPFPEEVNRRLTSQLVTSHRRESWGEPMSRTAAAVARLAGEFPQVRFVLPAHLNPAVREVLLPPLVGLSNVTVTEPLSYSDFAFAMSASSVMLTDSGGVQEEAPSLGKPVLVLRDTTERPEAVTAGTVQLVGTDVEAIVSATRALLTDPEAYAAMGRIVNPYGDGRAALRVRAAIEHSFGHGDRLPDFDS
jgi:UDP-N-acetylglucosamine 2-epimerase